MDWLAAHADTTPHNQHQDAIMSAIRIIKDISNQTNDDKDLLQLTVASINVTLGSPNTIPSKIVFSIDLRHPEINI